MQDTWHSQLFPLKVFELGFERHQVGCNHKLSICNLLFFMTRLHTMHWTPQTAQIITKREEKMMSEDSVLFMFLSKTR